MDEAALATILGASQVGRLQLELPMSGAVAVPVLRRHEERSMSAVPRVPDCWAPNKPALLFEGRTTWAEFILVRLVEAAGWEARWVKNWAGGRQLCVEVGEQRRLTGRGEEVFEGIHWRAPELRGAGTWDVIAWTRDEVLFLESKQARSGDHLRDSQLRFLDTAVQLGVPPDAFAVVEYDAGSVTGKRPRERATAATPRAVTARRKAQGSAPDPELIRLVESAAAAPADERIAYRDRVAGFGSAAIAPMEAWVSEGRSPGFAVAVLEAVGKSSDARAAVVALKGLSVTLPDWRAIIDPAIARVEGAHRPVGSSRARPRLGEGYVASGTPPPAQGHCGIRNGDGSACHNPGRWDIAGTWACTTHYKAATRRGEPW